jgi:hypothetical protein
MFASAEGDSDFWEALRTAMVPNLSGDLLVELEAPLL